jgi:TonB family protein
VRRLLKLGGIATALALIVWPIPGLTQTPPPSGPVVRVAVLSFGSAPIAIRVESAIGKAAKGAPAITVVDPDLARAAARGAGYTGSLNLTTQEAVDLGSAIGCDFYFLGDVQTLRRSPAEDQVYLESYATIFIVSARTGRLILWDRQTQSAPTANKAEELLLAEVDRTIPRYLTAVRDAANAERAQRFAAIGHDLTVLDETPADNSPDADGFRPPAPYRRVSPAYTAAANAAEVIATVDAQVDLDIEGEVQDVQIARWAGFGLDDAVTTAIRQMHFRPAMRNRIPFPIRVLLRYNFRKPK